MPSQQRPPAQPTSGPSLLTLAIASASSVVAAIVVSRIWGPGTIIGAAATPVIVTFVGELLKKPAEKITVVRVSPTGTQVHERAAPTSERDVPLSPPPAPGMAAPSEHRSRRRPLAIALATGLLAFVIGAVVLTSSELVLGNASVASGDRRTTLGGGGTKESARKEKEKKAPATPTTSTPTETKATTVPAPSTTTSAPTTPTETTPPAVPPDPTATDPAPGTGPTAP
jgi:hypothetical protein